MSQEDDAENLRIEKTELAGEIIDEPILSKTIREVDLPSSHRKLVYSPFFCKCGERIDKETARRCTHCKALLCVNCSLIYLKRVYCEECLQNVHNINLSKLDYKILLCVSHGITSKANIFRLTGIQPEVVEDKIESFLNKYTTKKPASLTELILRKLRLTHLGNDALAVFEGKYGNDLDCLILKKRIHEFKSERERKEKDYRLCAQGVPPACLLQDC